jgi:hypothetical protein
MDSVNSGSVVGNTCLVHATTGRVHEITGRVLGTIGRVPRMVCRLPVTLDRSKGRLPQSIIHISRLIELNPVPWTYFTDGSNIW